MGVDPVSIAMIGAAAVSAVGSLTKGSSESDALNYQAKIQGQNADAARVAAKADADRQQILANQKIGGIGAEYASSGVDSNSGSVLAVIGASAANSELDRQNILHGGDVRAINYQNQQNLDQTSAGNALKAGYYGAAASAIGVGAKLYSYGMGGGDTTNSWFNKDTTNYGTNAFGGTDYSSQLGTASQTLSLEGP
jgi:hypothetical protein